MYNSLLPVSSRHALFFCLFLSTFELLTYVASDVVMPGMLTVIKDLNAQLITYRGRLMPIYLAASAFSGLLDRRRIDLAAGLYYSSAVRFFLFPAWPRHG
jgi:DHA1 family multidrug/chloramphenicol efflux transport protein-like MFS transporter